MTDIWLASCVVIVTEGGRELGRAYAIDLETSYLADERDLAACASSPSRQRCSLSMSLSLSLSMSMSMSQLSRARHSAEAIPRSPQWSA
jgi:hypothetical protein